MPRRGGLNLTLGATREEVCAYLYLLRYRIHTEPEHHEFKNRPSL